MYSSKEPLISVVIPIYNAGRYLEQAMQSVLEQTFGDFEVIAVDDGSTDETPQLLAAMALRDRRVKQLHLERNSGIVKALNEGVRVASGMYIARMDADDISLPERFEQQIAFLSANPDIGLLGVGYWTMNAKGEKQKLISLPTADVVICWN